MRDAVRACRASASLLSAEAVATCKLPLGPIISLVVSPSMLSFIKHPAQGCKGSSPGDVSSPGLCAYVYSGNSWAAVTAASLHMLQWSQSRLSPFVLSSFLQWRQHLGSSQLERRSKFRCLSKPASSGIWLSLRASRQGLHVLKSWAALSMLTSTAPHKSML